MSEAPEPRTIELDRDVLKFVAAVLGLGGILVGLVALVSVGGFTDNLVAQIALGVGVIGILGFILLDPQALQAALTGRRARYASNSVLMSIAFAAILVIGFVILLDLEDQFDWMTVDLTEDQQFALSEQTLDILQSLDEPVHVYGFYTNRQSSIQDDAEIWLREYQQHSNGMLTFEFVDPEVQPGLASQLSVTRSGALILEQGDRTAEASLADERNLTGALIRVVSGETNQLYTLTGHGERSAEQFDDFSLQRASDTLERENYAVTPFNLIETATVPDDADVVVVAGPTTQFRAEEVEALDAYLQAGGAVMVLLEPNAATGIRTSGVQDVVFSPDGGTLAMASADDTGTLWDASSGRSLATLEGHSGDVLGIAFSPDGETVATASGDATVRLWSTNGDLLTTLQGHQASVRRIAWSPDGSLLASAGLDQAIILWDVESGEAQQVLTSQTPPLDVAFSPEGKLVAASYDDGSVRLWDVTGQEITNQRPHVGQAVSVAFSPDGETLLSSGLDGSVGILDVGRGVANPREPYPGFPVTDVSFLDDDTVIMALADGRVAVWDASLTSEQYTLQTEHSDVIWEVAVSPDGDTIATGGGNTVEIWSLSEQERLNTLVGDSAGDPLVNYLENEWGILVNDDLVVDVSPGNPFDEFSPVSFAYGISPITEPLATAQLPTFFTAARSLTISEQPPASVNLTELVLTSGNSWGETDLADLAVGTAPDETDNPGPLALAVSAENLESGARVVVVGDVDFAANASLQNESFGNLDLFVNTVNWLAEEEEFINIQPRSTTRSFTPLPGPLFVLTILASCALVPAILLGAGLLVWLQRRSMT